MLSIRHHGGRELCDLNYTRANPCPQILKLLITKPLNSPQTPLWYIFSANEKA